MVFDPKRKTIERVLETSEPLDSLDSIPESAVVAEMPEEKDEKSDSMETTDKSDEDTPEAPDYNYYVFNGKLYKVNVVDSADKTEVTRPGASRYVVDKGNKILYYVMYNANIVREDVGNNRSPEYIATGIGAVGMVTFDPENQVIFFTDVIKGQLEKLDLKNNDRTVLFRNLKNPRNLNTLPGLVFIFRLNIKLMH